MWFIQKQKNQAFTLIEILVAVAVFAIAMLAIGGIFIAVTKAQRKSKIEQRVQAEARYALELMGQEIRASRIDYAGYGSVSNPVSTLRLEKIDGEKITFRLSGENLEMTRDGSAEDVLSDNVKLGDLRFYLNPVSDPFDTAGPDEQPRVTVSLTIQDKDAVPTEAQALVRAQTTVTSREYRR